MTETSPPCRNDVDDNKMRCLNPQEHSEVRTGHSVAPSATVFLCTQGHMLSVKRLVSAGATTQYTEQPVVH